jgi:hypothetical protein
MAMAIMKKNNIEISASGGVISNNQSENKWKRKKISAWRKWNQEDEIEGEEENKRSAMA